MSFDPIRLASDSHDAGTFERQVLDALQLAIGFDAAFVRMIGEVPTAFGIDEPRLERAFGARAYEHELAPLKRAALARRGVAVDTEVYGGERAVRRLSYHRDFASRIGGRHTLVACMMLRGRPEGNTISTALAARALAWARGERVVASAGDNGAKIVIRDRQGYREMVAVRDRTELVWSRARLDDPRRSGWFYVDLFHLAAARASFRRTALFIGSGGGVGIRQFAECYPGIRLDLVEIEPRVIDLARDWYGLGSVPGLTFHVADGADFLRAASPSQWDIVIVDAYDETDFPKHMGSPAFFRSVKAALQPGGCLAFNVIDALLGDGPLQRIQRAARRELEDVRIVPVLDPDESYAADAVRNVVLLASRRR